MDSDWSIQEIARAAGTTSRTLRHYDDIGLLRPSRVGSNGYRYYDERALVRLQRILLLKELGLNLQTIADVLDRDRDEAEALTAHLAWLRAEQQRLERQTVSVERTIAALKGGERLMAEDMFDGFDHTQYRDEVEQRWGRRAYATADAWWRALSADEKSAWQQKLSALNSDWSAAATSGIAPDSAPAQDLAQRHVEWLTATPGTPSAERGGDLRGYVLGLGDMYVADPRFSANYGGEAGAVFVRDALRVFVETRLARGEED